MTPKEKAEDLVKKLNPYMYCYMGSGMLTNSYDEDVSNDNAKRCAIILVNEKIETCNKFYSQLSFPAEVKSDGGYIHFKKELAYLNDVIEEIEKL